MQRVKEVESREVSKIVEGDWFVESRVGFRLIIGVQIDVWVRSRGARRKSRRHGGADLRRQEKISKV